MGDKVARLSWRRKGNEPRVWSGSFLLWHNWKVKSVMIQTLRDATHNVAVLCTVSGGCSHGEDTLGSFCCIVHTLLNRQYGLLLDISTLLDCMFWLKCLLVRRVFA